jgi:CRISPR/Cas system-associated endoribonuclease Cas2
MCRYVGYTAHNGLFDNEEIESMNLNLDKIITGMGYLILIFLLTTRSESVSQIIGALGNFATAQTRALQGVTTAGATLIQGERRNGVVNYLNSLPF